MSLGAASGQKTDRRSLLLQEILENEAHFTRWIEHPSSTILHHDQECCESARLWFLAYARSMEIESSRFNLNAPTWLSKLFSWGPSHWPISWCEVVGEKIIDCGVFAALAREVFAAQGHLAHPAQVLISYNSDCTNHWKLLWEKEKQKKEKIRQRARDSREYFPWIGDEVVYHEVCLLEMPDETARVYDSTWGQWYLPQPRIGFASLLALRTECPRLLRWGDKTLSCGEWIDL